jgi:hypothetical protein
MGKASRNKQLKKNASLAQKKYGIKLSEALLVLCEPYKIANITNTQYERLVEIGAAAWNMANLPESDRQHEFLKLARRAPELHDVSESELIRIMSKLPDDADNYLVMLTMLSSMIGRKLELFPHDDRIVKNLWFEHHGQNNKLQVESIMHQSGGQVH